MSDLISRKKVIDILEKEKSLRCGYDADIAIFSIEKVVRELPTAYSVAKVVENIRCRCYEMGLDESQTEIIVSEIVKQGGVSDDVCEWKRDDTFRWMQAYKAGCCNKILDLTVRMALEMNQCPYCEKKDKGGEVNEI